MKEMKNNTLNGQYFGSDSSYLEVWMEIISDGRRKTKRIDKIKKILG